MISKIFLRELFARRNFKLDKLYCIIVLDFLRSKDSIFYALENVSRSLYRVRKRHSTFAV